MTLLNALGRNFLGSAPNWYKKAIALFLIINPIIYFTLGGFVTGWLLIAEFIFTLALALKCYPLPPGGLLALEAVAIGMTSAENVKIELVNNFDVILLLVFMVAGIFFMKDLLLFVFTKLLVNVRSKYFLSLLFCFVAAFLSAFLDALTVTAVLISVGMGFYAVYHKVASGKKIHHDDDHDHHDDEQVHEYHREDLDGFRSFLRSLIMHGAVGTALGGVCTLVGEPQNLLIAEKMGWHFKEFFLAMAPITMPTLISGLLLCVLLEKIKIFGYGTKLPQEVYEVLKEFEQEQARKLNTRDIASLIMQGLIAVLLIVALGRSLCYSRPYWANDYCHVNRFSGHY